MGNLKTYNNMERKEIQDRNIWCVVNPDGVAVLWSIDTSEGGAKLSFVEGSTTFSSWDKPQSLGYTVRKVKLTEIK